jgi:hypothetical protein
MVFGRGYGSSHVTRRLPKTEIEGAEISIAKSLVSLHLAPALPTMADTAAQRRRIVVLISGSGLCYSATLSASDNPIPSH